MCEERKEKSRLNFVVRTVDKGDDVSKWTNVRGREHENERERVDDSTAIDDLSALVYVRNDYSIEEMRTIDLFSLIVA